MNENKIKYKIWFYSLKMGINSKIKLLSSYKDEEEIYKNFNLIINPTKRNKEYFSTYNKEKELDRCEEIITYMEKNKIKFLSYIDDDYPEKLKRISCPPYGLFYKGDISLLNTKIVAIVGARTCTNYGVQVTKLLTNALNSYNITIISGGARGIDTVAHKNTLGNEGNTIVVLGCGIDVLYPKENRDLFKIVEERGLIITEFLPGTAPDKRNFPIRNRIISALSQLVIVVEASEKSGSLITASYAADQNIDVMTIPGPVTSRVSKGCNKLIKEGAIVFSELEDLYLQLGINKVKSNKKLSPEASKILSIIDNSPTHIDDIVNKSFIDREALYKVLFEMQIRNEVVSLPGNYYAKII